MFRSYLRLAIRTLRRRLGYTAVNVIGLTVGLACCALVAVFLQNELSYDAYHPGADRTYRVLSQHGPSTFSSIRFEGYRSDEDAAAEQRSLSQRLRSSLPAVEQAANFTIRSGPGARAYVETSDGNRYTSTRQLFTNTGPAVADLFAFERIAGPPLEQALSTPKSAVLTEPTAEQYFGDEDPIGNTITLASSDLTVRAVIAEPPSNSRLQFDLAVQLDSIPSWAAQHYLRLKEGADPAAVAPKVQRIMTEVNPELTENASWNGARLQPLTGIYLGPPTLYDDGPTRDPTYLWAFGAIAVLILVITTINYANLGLALYADRNQEIGVRKAIGSTQWQIAGQFLAEAVVLALLCVPLALGVSAALLPAFSSLMETTLPVGRLFRPDILGAMVGLAALTGGVAGGYPAFVLSRKKAVDLFGRGFSSGGGRRGWSLRHGLIALQFVILIGLGGLSWVVYDQLRYMQEGNLGYQVDNVVEINSIRNDSTLYQNFRRRLLPSSAVKTVGMGAAPRAATNRTPFSISGSDRTYEQGNSKYVDVHWFEVMGIEHPVVEEMKQAGPSAPSRALVNQAAADLIDGDPVGKTWTFNPEGRGAPSYRIDGVLPNLHLNSMRSSIPPTVYRVNTNPRWALNALVQFAPGRTQEGMTQVREVWSDLRPNTPLQTTFLETKVAALYDQERRFGALTAALAGLAILLAALGLASLVAYLTRLRMKEIGVRKALGGSARSIVALLNKEYVQIVGAAFLVGAPLAWLAVNWWLGQFAYRVDLSVLPFLAAGIGALIVAVFAVSTQAFRAARVDPARVLRSE